MRRLPIVAGLGVLALAGGAAIEGQLLAGTPSPENARPWLLAAALLGFAGMGLLERAALEHASEATSPGATRDW